MKTKKLNILINGELIKKDFEVPEFWSDRAALIVASKYAMDNEYSALQIIDRVVTQITDWGIQQNYFEKEGQTNDQEISEFRHKLKDILLNQRAAFNSPVWFNCGSNSGSQQMSACFILPIEDTMDSILNYYVVEGNIFKGGSGSGANISKLRAKGEKLSNKGESSGPVSFMRGWDKSAGTIKSGGKVRRAAKMICMDVDHPDIMEFIECKFHEENKAKILINNGISPEEAYSTVAFQNTNHSIRVTDEYMKACKDRSNWNLINRGDKNITKTLLAKDILIKAAEVAWKIGDPGIQYIDRVNLDNPVPSMGRIESPNPCAEFFAINSSSCNLASLNLVKYWDGERFNRHQFELDIEVLVTAMDILVDAAEYPTSEIRNVTTSTRPLGLGFTNLGAYLILKGLPYDSEEARLEAAYITRMMTSAAYFHSTTLAKKLGSFKAFEENKEQCIKIARRLFSDYDNWDDEIEKYIREYGLRNSQLTLLAPCGTISLMMDCDTTGIEPLYALKTTKTLAGGGTIELVPKCVEEYTKEEGNWNPDVIKTANKIHWKDHILMMAACQKHINGSISKTINMPSDYTIQDVYDAYMFGWEQGLKALAIYRDGSKAMQPLKTNIKVDKEVKTKVIKREKLPDTCYGPRQKFSIGGFKGYILVDVNENGDPKELFLIANKQGSTIQGLLDGLATVVSLALQYGVPLEKLVEKLKGNRFEPAGFTSDENIRFCKSIIDYVFKWLEQEFLDTETEINKTEHTAMVGNQRTYEGDPCVICGELTQLSGTCWLCPECGTTSGCS